jgi:hypothetical protein
MSNSLRGALGRDETGGKRMSRLYGPQHRELQQRFDSRTMADRI